MVKRLTSIVGIGIILLSFAACHNKNVKNPIAQVDSKQPDKILFDRAMDAMKHNKYDVARLTLQTLINTYPDSEFVARAKLAVGDSWYAEGSSAAMIQAENEYKDFITYLPNMPEAAEAQLKIANIHYKAMEKPDRDFTHAKRAEDEYRNLLTQWPDSKLVPEAKARLLEVQEVLAEREFRIGKFYFLRENWAASEARLKSLTETYPLYSGADEALFLLGETYQHRAEGIRQIASNQFPEAARGKMINKYEDEAAAAFAKIITRYPVTDKAEEARKKLAELRRPIPTPTAEAIAQNKEEEESRGKPGMWESLMSKIHKGPIVDMATKKGEPTLVDPTPTSAPLIIRQTQSDLVQAAAQAQQQGTGKVSLQSVKDGTTPGPSDPTPRSDNPPPAADNSAPQENNAAPAANNAAPADNNAIPELTPITDSSSSTTAQPAQPPQQVNEAATPAQPATQQPAQAESSSSSSSTATTEQKTDDNKQPDYSTSKKKKKSGLRKVVPF
jgi:outer membrane protein assembly factor BamD